MAKERGVRRVRRVPISSKSESESESKSKVKNQIQVESRSGRDAQREFAAGLIFLGI